MDFLGSCFRRNDGFPTRDPINSEQLLQTLRLDFAPISTLTEDVFDGLTNLEELDLAANDIAELLPGKSARR